MQQYNLGVRLAKELSTEYDVLKQKHVVCFVDATADDAQLHKSVLLS